jgi:hypothetical protein
MSSTIVSLPNDTNAAGRAVPIGRKNYISARSDAGGEHKDSSIFLNANIQKN